MRTRGDEPPSATATLTCYRLHLSPSGLFAKHLTAVVNRLNSLSAMRYARRRCYTTPIPHICRYAEAPIKGVEPSILLQTTVFKTASHRWGNRHIHQGHRYPGGEFQKFLIISSLYLLICVLVVRLCVLSTPIIS